MPTKSASKTITRDPNWLGPAIPPGEMLLEEFLKPMSIGQVEAARRLGISLNRLNEIVLGKRGITADTALRLARLFKTSAQFWMRLQADWDLHQAMQRECAKGIVNDQTVLVGSIDANWDQRVRSRSEVDADDRGQCHARGHRISRPGCRLHATERRAWQGMLWLADTGRRAFAKQSTRNIGIEELFSRGVREYTRHKEFS